jgi:hypothetical protein
MRPYCTSLSVLGVTASRYARSFEKGRAIALCLSVHPPLQTLWPKVKMFI